MLITKEVLQTPVGVQKIVPFGEVPGYYRIWGKQLMEKGISILASAKVPELLKEFAEAIRDDFPDVELEKPTMSETHGSVAMAVNWNFRPCEEPSVVYNHLSLIARLATRDITVFTNKGWYILTENDWGDPDNVAKAIVIGFQDPARWQRPNVSGQKGT